MKFIFNVQDTVVIDSRLFKDCETVEQAWALLDEGFGRTLDRDVMLVEISGE